MKFLRAFLLSLVVVLIVPSITHAREIIKEQNGEKCIDLEAIYADINDSSKALTGDDKGIDAVKKAQIVSSLTNIMGILAGEGIYCINDEEAAAKVGYLENTGLLGYFESANSQLMAFFPSGNVVQHLAEEFVPGYGENSSLLAQSYIPPTSDIPTYNPYTTTIDPIDPQDEEGEANSKVNKVIEEQLEDASSQDNEDLQELADEAEANQEQGEEMTMSGYSYLKDKVHLDSIWGFFRNIAYVFFIIIMIITGFMIMFRKELPGQVVVGISNTLPQIILGIILVTFSFAIVGIVMDIGKVSMRVVSNVFEQAYEDTDTIKDRNIEDVITVGGVGTLTNQALQASKQDGLIPSIIDKIPLIGPPIANLWTSFGGTVSSMAIQTFGLYKLNKAADNVGTIDINIDWPGNTLDPIFDTIIELTEGGFKLKTLPFIQAGIMVLLVRNIIFLLICLYASFKVFLTMWMTYLKLFVNVIFAPIQIMLGSLPGNFSMTSQWFKSVIANVLVFVGIHLIINLAAYLSAAVDPKSFNFFGNNGALWPNWIISFQGIILIGGYLFASNMPQIINGVLKIETSRELQAVGQSVKQSASKIPLVGGMFGG